MKFTRYLKFICLTFLFLLAIPLSVFAGDSSGDISKAQKLSESEFYLNKGHDSKIHSVRISPDGTVGLTASEQTVKLWDLNSGREIHTLKAENTLYDVSASFSPDGKHVIVSGRPAILWDVASGRKIFFYEHRGRSLAAAFSFDGSKILLGSDDGKLSVIDRTNNQLLYEIQAHDSEERLASIACGPGGMVVTGGYDKKVHLWNIATGEKIRSFGGWFGGHSESVEHVSVSADGKYAFSRTPYSDDHHLWNVATGDKMEIPAQLKEYDFFPLAFSPDGQSVICNRINELFVWTIESGNIVKVGTPLTGVNSAEFSSDGRYVFVGHDESTPKLLSMESQTRTGVFDRPAAQSIDVAAIDSTGEHVIVGDTGTLPVIWNIKNGQVVNSFEETGKGHFSARGAQFSTDGQAIMFFGQHVSVDSKYDGAVGLWDVKTGREISYFNDHKNVVYFAASSPDGRLVATADGKKIYLHDVTSGKIVKTLKRHTDEVESLAISPDGKQLLSCDDESVRLWELPSGRLLRVLGKDMDYLRQVFFSPDGRIALAASDDQIFLWDAFSGEEIRIISYEDISNTTLSSITFSADGTELLIVHKNVLSMMSQGGNFVRILNVASGEIVTTFDEHSEPIVMAKFTDDSERIVTASKDRTLRVWDIATGKEIYSSIAFENGEWITITPDGYFNASSHGADQLNVRQNGRVYGIGQFYDKLYRPDIVQARINGQSTKDDVATVSIAQLVQSGSAPQVAFIAPAGGKTAKRDIEAVVELRDQGGGFGKVVWKLNGVTVGVEEAGRGISLKKKAADKRPFLKLAKLLTLSPGENRIEVVAYNAEDKIASDPATIKLTVKDAISEKPALHVLTVGINKYRDKSLWLNYSVPDAQSLSQSMNTVGKTIFSNVSITEIYDQQATVSGIGNAFEHVSKKAKPHDVFVLYLAGHGITLDGKYHFLPADFRYRNEDSVRQSAITQDHLQNWMSRVSAQKSLVLLDTCNSGSFVQAQATTRGIAEKTAIDKLTRATGRATIAASSDTQVALEGYEGHGVFTYALLKAMNEADQKNGNRDGVTSTAEIASYIDNAVPDMTYKKWGYEQVPQVNLHGREFPIGVTH